MASPSDYSHALSDDLDHRCDTTLLREKQKEDSSRVLTTRWSIRRRQIIAGLAALGLATAAFAAYGISSALRIAPDHAEYGDCGSTIDEAKAKGCIFDNLSYVWVQPACHHPELLQSFRDRSNITYYTSHDLTLETRIPQEDIYAGNWPWAWSTKEQHPVHCAFLLSKMHEALSNHLPLDDKVMQWEHTIHCSEVLLQSWLSEIEDCNLGRCERVKVTQGFTKCGYY
ncbi:hypothetical protein BDV96DRAFT_158061 [Lophiotrema nucula]|uniref:Uncharacterized protein n=1 Tax=Lophiotrema nucula TaxID=690887 RepID=A0A6A5YYT0_9PLEO|nr:hypothetical protein BDV96DRAFT_158061 [Lophiotrema nucula]